MGASAKVTANAPAIPDTRVMMFLLLRSLPSPWVEELWPESGW
jgi:hypothetical protein